MPRQTRLDCAGTLHHVMIRGIEKRRIVDDLKDRDHFVSRLGGLILFFQNNRLLFELARADLFPESFFFLLPVLSEGGAEKASGGERKSLRGSTFKPFGWNVLMPISRRLQLC
jgi:hypothetical protein